MAEISGAFKQSEIRWSNSTGAAAPPMANSAADRRMPAFGRCYLALIGQDDWAVDDANTTIFGRRATAADGLASSKEDYWPV